MANEIDGVSKSGLPKISDVTAPRRVDSEKTPGEERTASESRGNDTVALTDGARLLQRVEAQLAEAGETDPARIESIKTAIANGEYQIDDREIADKILRSDRERG